MNITYTVIRNSTLLQEDYTKIWMIFSSHVFHNRSTAL